MDELDSHQEYLHWTYFGDGALDAEEFARMGALFAGVDLFIDVGASHGVYTRHALDHMVRGRVIAIEADPTRFAILERNVTDWVGDDGVEVQCLKAAASDDQDLAAGPTTTFFTTETQISGGLFPVNERSDEYRPVEIPLVRLDDLVDSVGSVLVKIDVEGGELRVLRGAKNLIRSGRARFFVELSWWGDRERGTSVWTTLRFLHGEGLGIERRLRSDYLIQPEHDPWARRWQYLRVLPALLPRWLFGRLAPYRLRRAYIRRQNRQRVARASLGPTESSG